ncbi:symmetrical bis(5'-nucleosyl)-tetraphosphatase [Salinimonas lutimaris]|uniref:symmetrical bis(5'-nucleosyl)-tetraphosphatase n=1 Tax=Salinimonas lutimaris TaxID=914153 RepID=UPI0010C1474E|nr:symmetrical bis(5'-nucleosyl)-tetraphosphatase [Salinimonas lutimaris]
MSGKAQTLVVGDIQGCYNGLIGLLNKCKFDPDRDRLLAVGDLVARGENSLATVEYLMSLGDRFHTVLGNHDLHLLAVMEGIKSPNKKDRVGNLLKSPRKAEISQWLRQFPLASRISSQHVMVHAGLYPAWTPDDLLKYSAEVEAVLSSPDYLSVLQGMYGNGPECWDKSLKGMPRLRFIINACTRMRFVTANFELDMHEKGAPPAADPLIQPWYKLATARLPADQHIVFGHWAALDGETSDPRIIGLDTGYVWGNTMTALRLEDGRRICFSA